MGVIGFGHALGWFDEAATVAREEFGPRAALEKYEWFIDQSQAIKKMDADVALYTGRLNAVNDRYGEYGTDKGAWPLDVRTRYGSDSQQARDDLTAIVSQRNNLVRDYNAASEKFNWSPFQTRADLPPTTFKESTAP